ncbi:MAG: hypothetical protein LQ338_003390 [Usnochroma carphineum]|nr:MAG: hypothetical protein LQ338_003390 [Usnochroma carphineum]
MKRKRSEDSDSTSSQIAPEDIPLPISEPSTPKPPRTPTLQAQGLPLTLENLQQLPGSPPKQPPSNEAMSHLPPQSANANHNPPVRVDDVTKFLQLHGMRITTSQYYRDHPAIVGKVEEILSKPSQADLQPESAEKILTNIERLERRNEATFFEDIWMRIFHASHPIQKAEYKGKWDTGEWDVQGLDNNRDQIFRVGGVSALEPKNPLHQAILNEVSNKIQTPKPDQTFGVAEWCFSKDEMAINNTIENWASVSPGIYHSFFVVEFKGHLGIMAEATNQALRAASTLVEVNRSMRDKAKMQDLKQPGVDTSTFVFSICMTTDAARLYVNWAEVDDQGHTEYNMSLLRVVSMWSSEDHKKLRQDLGRVLHWGTDARLKGPDGVRAMLAKFIKQPSLLSNKTATSSQQAASSKAESSNKPEASSNKGGVTTRSQAKSGS